MRKARSLSRSSRTIWACSLLRSASSLARSATFRPLFCTCPTKERSVMTTAQMMSRIRDNDQLACHAKGRIQCSGDHTAQPAAADMSCGAVGIIADHPRRCLICRQQLDQGIHQSESQDPGLPASELPPDCPGWTCERPFPQKGQGGTRRPVSRRHQTKRPPHIFPRIRPPQSSSAEGPR